MATQLLILVPTVTIREQWVDRIQTAFLEDGQRLSDLVSQNLKEMKVLTIVTYQAFHSAMNQLQSQEDGEAEDFVGFDLLASLRAQKVATLFVWTNATTCAMNGGKVWKLFMQAVWTAETHLPDSDTTI